MSAAGTPRIAVGDYVGPLAAFDRADTARAGGKGANLGALTRAGFAVPPGFVVTTAAYDLMLERAGLTDRIPELLATGPRDGSAVRRAVATAEVPVEVADAVRAAYHRLGAGPVAVRSSATAEDLPTAAFAGQQDTYLDVVGADAVLDAVRRCWASLWTERAIAYRRRHGFDATAARMAVVVQRMVPADAAGVLFTANPITGARHEAVVAAGRGLGEAVVSGLSTPDHVVVSKRAGRIRRAQTHGGSPLSAFALRRLVRVGTRVERHFGTPQDIEWAMAGGRIHLLQARPMTALPEPAPATGRVQRVAAAMLAEMVPVRPYPLDVTTWTSALHEAINGLLRVAGITSPPLAQICVEEDDVVVRLRPPAPRPSARTLLTPVRLVRLARRYDPADLSTDPAVEEITRRATAFRGRDLSALSWEELLDTLRQALAIAPDAMQLRRRYLPRAVLAAARLRLVLALVGRGSLFGALLSGVETKTTETNRALEALAATIRSDPALAETFAAHEPTELFATLRSKPECEPFLASLWTFLDRYGHRETTTALLATQRTWYDAPEVVLGIVKGFAAGAPPPREPAAQAARRDLLAHPVLRRPPMRSGILALLDTAGRVLQVREDTRFYATLPLPTIRHVFVELGRRLAVVGVLDDDEDVFHLKLRELERVAGAWPPADPLVTELGAAARQRAAARAALADRPLLDPRLFPPADPVGEALVRGTAASPGVAQGPARIIRAAAEFGRLRHGDVLVAPYTNPAWTPLFERAVAVVADTGGPASHAAIVAREYGIPAVMGTVDATRRLVDGSPVRVDGNRGLVLPPAGGPP